MAAVLAGIAQDRILSRNVGKTPEVGDIRELSAAGGYAFVAARARNKAVALGNGADFGDPGRGFVRINVACAPDTLREAIARIARIASGTNASPITPGASA